MNISQNIHYVNEVTTSTYTYETKQGTKYYIRNIYIKTDDGEIVITLFSDNDDMTVKERV